MQVYGSGDCMRRLGMTSRLNPTAHNLMVLLTVALALYQPVFATDWPQFRGPNGDGISEAASVPLHWSQTDHVVWKQVVPGTGWSSPVLSEGKLYVTTAVSDPTGGISLRALRLNADDGRIDWDVEVIRPESGAAKQMHNKNSLASPTPIIDGDRLYVHFGHMGTAALDTDGNVVWTQTALTYKPRHGNAGSPVLVDDLVVFSCDAEEDPFIAALDCHSGDVRWKVDRRTSAVKTFSFSTPTVIEVDGAKQIISAGSGMVGAYRPEDGEELWRVEYDEGYSVVPRPVFSDGLVFVISGFETPTLLAIDPHGASGKVTESHVKWRHKKGAPLTPSVLVVDDELYFVSDAGVASCLDTATGKVRWTKRLGGNFSASPVFADGRIYFLSEEGRMHVVARGRSFQLLAANDIEERTLASAAVSHGALYVRSETHLWCFGG
jgi:outer membrane protein assembly factor BamB